MTQYDATNNQRPASPENKRGDKYKCYPTKLAEQLEMISGRMVSEIRGTVQTIEYAYDYMPDEQYKALLMALS